VPKQKRVSFQEMEKRTRRQMKIRSLAFDARGPNLPILSSITCISLSIDFISNADLDFS